MREEKRGRGRPRLGVVSREIGLLPRHWAWLKQQPRSASAALRRLVDQAAKATAPAEATRLAREKAYRSMSRLGGDLPGFEEASRALFAGDLPGLRARMEGWPEALVEQILAELGAPAPAEGWREPSHEQGRTLAMRRLEGPVTMLNLLRFRQVADYAASPGLAPDEPISGEHAYRLYMAHTAPILAEAGGELLFDGAGGSWLIGPEAEGWDRVLLVRHASVEAFFGFARNERYLAGLGHRTAALADSRLLPLA
jgi:uncharacterized protein (DUF1330 family)